jgi:hypothetical protein
LPRHQQIKTPAMMKAMMPDVRRHLDVLWPVVLAIPIEVVWNFSGPQPSAQLLFGDEAVFIGVSPHVG